MSRLVVDASVAVKWVVDEDGSDQAASLLVPGNLAAPDLLVAECANILWKKVRRDELTVQHAELAARVLARADVELYPMRALLEPAAKLAIDLDHPAYDCIYLALAMVNGWRFVTADKRLIAKVRQRRSDVAQAIIGLDEIGAPGERH